MVGPEQHHRLEQQTLTRSEEIGGRRWRGDPAPPSFLAEPASRRNTDTAPACPTARVMGKLRRPVSLASRWCYAEHRLPPGYRRRPSRVGEVGEAPSIRPPSPPGEGPLSFLSPRNVRASQKRPTPRDTADVGATPTRDDRSRDGRELVPIPWSAWGTAFVRKRSWSILAKHIPGITCWLCSTALRATLPGGSRCRRM